MLGETDSDFTDGLQRIDDIIVQEGSNLLDLNMPVDPNGVGLRLGRAYASYRCSECDAGRRAHGSAGAEKLLRRSEPAGSGNDAERLLQVRYELLESGCAQAAGVNYVDSASRGAEQHLDHGQRIAEFIPPTSDLSSAAVRRAGVSGRPGTDANLATAQTTAKHRPPSLRRLHVGARTFGRHRVPPRS